MPGLNACSREDRGSVSTGHETSLKFEQQHFEAFGRKAEKASILAGSAACRRASGPTRTGTGLCERAPGFIVLTEYSVTDKHQLLLVVSLGWPHSTRTSLHSVQITSGAPLQHAYGWQVWQQLRWHYTSFSEQFLREARISVDLADLFYATVWKSPANDGAPFEGAGIRISFRVGIRVNMSISVHSGQNLLA